MGRHMYFAKLGGAARVMFPGTGPAHLSRLVARLESECRPRSKAERIAPEAVLRRHAARRDHQLHGGAIQEETHRCGLGERYRQSRIRVPLSPKPAAPLHRNYTGALKGSRQQRPQLGGKKPELQGLRSWRPEAESNRCTRICSPLHSHSAIRPARRGI